MSQLFITLPSNSSMDYYPNNTLTNYRTRLEKTLDLSQGEWEVGLWEIQYPHNWQSLKTQVEATIRIFDNAAKQFTEYPLETGYYTDIQSLLRAINSVVGVKADFRWNSIASRVEVAVTPGYILFFPQTLANMLGLPIRLPFFEEPLLGTKIHDIKRGLHSLYVYCDLLQHQIVGDRTVPLLRIVPVRGSLGSVITRTYENVQYMPAKAGQWRDIEIDIRDDSGEPIHFESGKVWVTLHLRRAASPYFRA